MKPKFILLTIFICAACLFGNASLSFAASEDNELEEYFELRDTITLMNDEMKKVIEGKKEQSIFSEGDPIQNLNGTMTFIEQRIDEFAEKDTQLKYHYVKNLRNAFAEAAKLHMQAKAIYIQDATKKAKESFENTVNAVVLTNLEKEYADSVDPWKRPYFEPIDVRLLAAVPRSDPNAPKSYEFGKTKIASKTSVTANNKAKEEVKQTEAPEKEVKEKAKQENVKEKETLLAKSVKETSKDTGKEIKNKDNKEANKTEKSKNLEIAKANARDVFDKLNKKIEELEKLEKATKELPPLLPPKVGKDDKKTASVKETIKKEEKKEKENLNVPVSVKKPVEIAGVVEPELKQTAKEAKESKPVPTGLIKGDIKSPIRPMAIMIENHNAARPQTGLWEADVVYEIPVEGGITRFMGIFTKIPGIVGPIRSCREYFVDRALEANAVYIHCGGSPKGYDYISSSKIFSMDEIQYGKPFYRDNSRKAPHNLYSKGRSLFDAACTLYPMLMAKTPEFLHKGKNDALSSESAVSVSIRYHEDYSVVIKYNKGSYERYMNGTLHVDRETQKPLEAKAVVIQTANMKVVDKVGRQEISFIGKGEALILENGKITKTTWQKDSPNAVTKYIKEDGKEYLFPEKGKIWVQVVSPTHKMEIKDKE